MASNTKEPSLSDVNTNLTPDMLKFLSKLMTDAQGRQNPEGPTPPQPPQPGQNADVTGSRPLHSETVPARQLDIQPGVKPSVFTPRGNTTTMPRTGDDATSDDMLQTVSSHTMTSIVHHQTANFTPSSHAMYMVLAQMDKTMSTTKRWLDNSFGWIPAYSRLYYGVLFIIQVLRAQRDAGTLGLDEMTVLKAFEESFTPGNLLVAGPLVPIFKAISTSKVDSDLFGNVAPKLPASVRLSSNTAVVPTPTDDNVKWNIPAVPAIFDEICTAIHLSSGTNGVYTEVMINGSAPGAYGVHFPQTTPATDAMNMPGMYQNVPLNESIINNFRLCAPSYSFPDPFDQNRLTNGVTNWFSYCRLLTGRTKHHDWMSRLSGTMNNYAQYFRGSLPLGDISSNSLPAGQLQGTYNAQTLPTADVNSSNLTRSVNTNNTTAYYYQRPEISNLSANWTSATMAVPTPEEWRAMFAQVNCLHPNLQTARPATYRTGTFWTLPDVRVANLVDPTNSVPLIIARKFHRSNRDETI